MKDLEVQKVMDREKIAKAVHGFLDAGLDLMSKADFRPVDHAKIKVLRTMSSHVNAAVVMVQQETAQQRHVLVQERMKQLGYGEAKQLKD